jgi:type I restriction enzyme R subunit
MAEYRNVEKPFLSKLESLGWQVIDQGFGVPKNPTKSLRSNFKEVTLKEEFKKSIHQINQFEGNHGLQTSSLKMCTKK